MRMCVSRDVNIMLPHAYTPLLGGVRKGRWVVWLLLQLEAYPTLPPTCCKYTLQMVNLTVGLLGILPWGG